MIDLNLLLCYNINMEGGNKAYMTKEKKEFLELYREYIGEYDDTYEELLVTDEELIHNNTVILDLLGADITGEPTDMDYDRIARYAK